MASCVALFLLVAPASPLRFELPHARAFAQILTPAHLVRVHAPAAHMPRSQSSAVSVDPAVAFVGPPGILGVPHRVLHTLDKHVTRPLLMHFLIISSVLQRHTITRSSKMGSYRDSASRITWIGGVVNLALAVFKAFAGFYGNSAAMIADASHSFSDLLSDGLTLVTLRMSALPPDLDHPYGHGRFESIGSLMIASILVTVGFSFGASAFAALRSPSSSMRGILPLVAASVSIISKEMLYRATFTIGKRIKSQVLIANAWHHRSDSLSSVVALVGIAGWMLGVPQLDALAGMVVAGLVSWMGVRIGVDALAQLSDTSDYAIVQEVDEIARSVKGVQDVHQTRCRSMGGSSLVDLAIRVEPKISASAAHKLAEQVRVQVLDESSSVSEVLVHVDTSLHDYSCPLQSAMLVEAPPHHEIEAQVRARLLQTPDVLGVHSVQVHYLTDGIAVDAQLQMAEHLKVSELRTIAAAARARLQESSSPEHVDLSEVRISLALPLDEAEAKEAATPSAVS